MNYIYDIVLNFQENYYQFFEWNKKDKIKNIKKIPIYHLNDTDLLNLINNKITVDNNFINKIKEDNKTNKKIICLVSNTKLTLGLLFDEQGHLLKRSSLIYEEEDEVNTLAITLPLTKINYLTNITTPKENKLRIEIEKKNQLLDYINSINNTILLKYLYYEYFKEEENNNIKIKEALTQELEKNWTKKQNDLYHLVMLMNKNKLSPKERTNSG